ncbi:hypothetical protein A1O7_01600 [Cladophialophora yegresii CBS 114405]|uniref:Uncharacterized protein n=1 Tax=Cladophialophora yegresii CBS 114405 TaxID=1182544 RepID=W9X452_9EURO|nr:uncharacterized protein A1O7_01600 [Cladophialophora yegresii CBS 114405]EXJ65259.1 hypothetical protein A1O7_01600 [Cladophialophora yegresii CBS 114405]
MSQITILGFTPAELVSSSQGSNAIHWTILLSPTSSAPQHPQQSQAPIRPKTKSFFSSQRRVSKDDSDVTTRPRTALFDMHKHQLRQQELPGPITPSDRKGPTDSPNTATSISSDVPNEPFTLSLRILLSTHSLPVAKLAKKVSPLLYRTPTYGPEEDWLRAALDMLVGAGILEPAAAFDGDLVLAFASEAVKEYLGHMEQGQHTAHNVLELDYAKHIREMESVRTMFSRDSAATSGNADRNITASSGATQQHTPAETSSHTYFHLHHGSKTSSKPASDSASKKQKFFGFRVSPGPHASGQRQRWASGDRAWYERRDDPYGGLM